MIRRIILDGREIELELQRKNVKNINLRIKPDGRLCLSANRLVPEKTIFEFLNSNSKKIISTLDRFASLEDRLPKEERFDNGDEIYFLGKKEVLRLYEGKRNHVEHQNGFVFLTVKDTKNVDLKSKTVEKWRRAECGIIITALCKMIYPLFEPRGVPFPELRFRKMKSRWGSCQPKKAILTFNTALIGFPTDAIEYVVMHEFAHFIKPNHSKEYYKLLDELMPDWKTRKSLLIQRF